MTGTASPSRRTTAVIAVMAVLAVAVAVIGVVLLVRAQSLRDDADRADRAVVDARATSQVVGQVSTGLAQVLSYDYAHPEVAAAAAKKWLTGDAPKQYAVLLAQLEQLARGQNLTLVAKVVTAGVTSLKGDHAQLLVFVDQQSTRASDGQSSVSAAQVQIGAVRSGGVWRIAELHPL